MKKQIILLIVIIVCIGSLSLAFVYGKKWHEEQMIKQVSLTALNIIAQISKEFKETGEVRFAPLVFDEDGSVVLDASGNPQRGKLRVLIQKQEIKLIE